MAAVSSAEESERVRIAVLPVVVHSAELPGYLREGLADMLASRLEQVPQFEVIRVDESENATTRLTTAIKKARKLETDFVLFGSFTQFGQGASLDMQCAATAQAPGEMPLREIFVHSGSIGEVIPDLQDLVGKISRFTVAGYEGAQAVSAEPAATNDNAVADAQADEIESLWMRVQALEDVVRRLEDATGAAALEEATDAVDESAGDPETDDVADDSADDEVVAGDEKASE
jgi:TolB-like protein